MLTQSCVTNYKIVLDWHLFSFSPVYILIEKSGSPLVIPPKTFKGPYSRFPNIAKVHLEEVHMYDFSTDSFIGLENESSKDRRVEVLINLTTIKGVSQPQVPHQVILGSFIVANSNISHQRGTLRHCCS